VIGLIYLQLSRDQRGVQNREGALFFLAVNGMMTSIMGVLTTFSSEKLVFIREYGSGMYRLPAYFLSRIAMELPFRALFPLLGASISYWLVGFQTSGSRFIIYAILLTVLENCGAAIGIMVACVFQDIAVALAVVPVFILPLMIFSGYFANADSLPVFLGWIKWLSPVKYTFVGLVKNEFKDLSFYCTNGQYSTSPTGDQTCPYTHGEQVITVLGFDNQLTIAENIIILCCLYVGFLGFAYFAIWRQLKKRRT